MSVQRALGLGNSEEGWEACKPNGASSVRGIQCTGHPGQRPLVYSDLWAPCAAAGKVVPFSSTMLHPEVKGLHPEVKVLCSVEEERAGAGNAGKVINITNCMREKWESEKDVRVNTLVK